MHHASAGAHALHLARAQHFAVTHGVLMGELAFHHHGDDFHALVRVHPKALARGDRVVIDHTQRAEAHPIGVVVVRKAEAVPAIKPIPLAVKALCCRPQAAQAALRCGGHRLSTQVERLHLH